MFAKIALINMVGGEALLLQVAFLTPPIRMELYYESR